MRKLDSRKCWECLAPQLINHPDCPDWLRTLAHKWMSARGVTDHAPPFSVDYSVSLRLALVDQRAISNREAFLEVAHREGKPDDVSATPYRKDTDFLRTLVGSLLAQFEVMRKVRIPATHYERGPVLWFTPDDFQLLRVASSIVVGRPIPA